MFLKPCFYMVIIHYQVVIRLVSDIIKLYHLTIGLLPHPWSNLMIQWLILIFSHLWLYLISVTTWILLYAPGILYLLQYANTKIPGSNSAHIHRQTNIYQRLLCDNRLC